MSAIPSEPPETGRSGDHGLNSLERLGAFFTSQIHDLNNQMAVLSNSELICPQEQPLSPETSEFMQKLFKALHRLSATCQQFNAIRRIYPVEVEKIPLPAAVDAIIGAVGHCKGWTAKSTAQGERQVLLNAAWLPEIVSQLIAHMPTANGHVEISVGELPARQYFHSLRTSFSDRPSPALLVSFKGGDIPAAPVADEWPAAGDFQVAVELVRLLGAGISLAHSDSNKDYLLALRLQGV